MPGLEADKQHVKMTYLEDNWVFWKHTTQALQVSLHNIVTFDTAVRCITSLCWTWINHLLLSVTLQLQKRSQ